VEADFQREYHMNLTRELAELSWRRLVVLVRGLGPQSATAVKMQVRKYGANGAAHRGGTAGAPVVRGKAAAARELARIFGDRRPAGGGESH
jgi:hypothetical protein